jgi:hypothetical protein
MSVLLGLVIAKLVCENTTKQYNKHPIKIPVFFMLQVSRKMKLFPINLKYIFFNRPCHFCKVGLAQDKFQTLSFYKNQFQSCDVLFPLIKGVRGIVVKK